MVESQQKKTKERKEKPTRNRKETKTSTFCHRGASASIEERIEFRRHFLVTMVVTMVWPQSPAHVSKVALTCVYPDLGISRTVQG